MAAVETVLVLTREYPRDLENRLDLFEAEFNAAVEQELGPDFGVLKTIGQKKIHGEALSAAEEARARDPVQYWMAWECFGEGNRITFTGTCTRRTAQPQRADAACDN